MDAAANLALFLQEKTGSIWGTWGGKMTAAEQRNLFGRFLGKGRIIIDGNAEEVQHWHSVCFGTMRDMNKCVSWRNL